MKTVEYPGAEPRPIMRTQFTPMFRLNSNTATNLTLASFALPFVLLWPTTATTCKFDVSKIYGKIQFVDSFPDYKVKVVNAFPDLKVKKVSAFPDRPGKWRIVTSCPDYKIQLVDAFPDFKIRYVDAFPGVP